MRRRRSAFAVLALLAALVASACQPPAVEPLTDPREVLARMIAATAQLRTATVRVDVQARDAANPDTGVGGVTGGSVEAQLDLAAGAWTARGVGADGSGGFALIAIGGSMFHQPAGSARWTQIPIQGDTLPASLLLGARGAATGGIAPDYAAILRETLGRPAVRIELVGVEDCASGRCYRVALDIPPDESWPLVSRLLGLDQLMSSDQVPAADQLPRLTVVVLADATDLHLVDLAMTAAVQASTVHMRIQVADPNRAVAIAAPPQQLVDPVDAASGGGAGAGGGVAVPPRPRLAPKAGVTLEPLPPVTP